MAFSFLVIRALALPLIDTVQGWGKSHSSCSLSYLLSEFPLALFTRVSRVSPALARR